MNYLSVSEIANLWGISERSVRNYCSHERISGAFMTGKTWNIPADAQKPERASRQDVQGADLLHVLKKQKENRLPGGIYHKVQVEMTYNSGSIEGITLTHDQTSYIFETNTLGATDRSVNVDDVIETANHFKCIDMVIDNAAKPLTERFIKELHLTLKIGSSDSRKSWFAVGDYKRIPNEVGGQATAPPEQVAERIRELLKEYNSIPNRTFDEIVSFHAEFEKIHPFQDGNGRVGRLILFKECLRNNIVPFFISEDTKASYYRGLRSWQEKREPLITTCAAAQEQFRGILDYFRISYQT